MIWNHSNNHGRPVSLIHGIENVDTFQKNTQIDCQSKPLILIKKRFALHLTEAKMHSLVKDRVISTNSAPATSLVSEVIEEGKD